MPTATPSTVGDLARVGSAPSRRSAQLTVDQWNEAMRQSPLYQKFVTSRGLSTSRGGWSRADQAAWERELAANGVQIPSGMHIDQGGNLNQKNRLGRNVAITAGVTAATLATLGAAGVGPAAGMFGSGASTAATGATAATTAATGTGATVAASSPFWSPSTLKLLELGIGTGTSLWANRTAANADRERGAREDAAAAEALAFLQRQDELDRQRYDEERTRLWGHQDIDRARAEEDRQLMLRREGEREARLEPLRGGSGAFATLNDLAGLRPSSGRRPSSAPAAAPPPVRATDWDGTYATGPGPRIDDAPRGGRTSSDGLPEGHQNRGGTTARPAGIPVDWVLTPTMDGSGVFWAPPGTRTLHGGSTVATTMPVGRRPPANLAELAGMRA